MRSAALALFLALAAAPVVADAPPRIEVFKTPSCGCCGAWIDHMRAEGFDVTARDVAPGALVALKDRLGVGPEHASCHTAVVGGYVVEGHVPASDVRRLLAERPDALGLSVPGMPIGSPGMEQGDEKEPYDTLLIGRDGAAETFTRHR